jgi:hypothetical protein
MHAPPASDPRDPRDLHHDRLAAVLLAIGAAGVIVTSAFYVLSGPAASLPGGAAAMDAARAATAHAAGTMRVASLFGMPSDVVFTVGGLMFAASKRRQGAALAYAGWLAMGISGILFTIVDAMVGHVLPAAAAAGDAAYVGVRALFDVLFAVGGWAFGLGALAASWSARGREYRWRAAAWLMRVSGVLGIVANAGWLLGLPGAPLIGPAIALGAAAVLVLAAGIVRDPEARVRPATLSSA